MFVKVPEKQVVKIILENLLQLSGFASSPLLLSCMKSQIS